MNGENNEETSHIVLTLGGKCRISARQVGDRLGQSCFTWTFGLIG